MKPVHPSKLFPTLMMTACLLGLPALAPAAPIHEAAKNGDVRAVQQLVVADPKQVAARDKEHGNTPLHWAAYRGHLSVVKYLLDRDAPIDALTVEGYTPMRDAAYQGHLAVVQELLRHRSRGLSTADARGAYPLHWAALAGHENVVRLMATYYYNGGTRDRDGKLAEDWARQAGHQEVARLLQLQPLRRQLSSQISGGNLESVKALLQQHPDLIHLPLGYGLGEHTFPLHDAQTVPMARLLLQAGANIEARGRQEGEASWANSTALHMVATGSNTDLLEFLLSQGADIGARNEGGLTPLHEAARCCSVQPLIVMLMAGASVNDQTPGGLAALHLLGNPNGTNSRRSATPANQLACAKVLLQHGALKTVQNQDGLTPAQWARKNGHNQLAEFLKK